MNQPAVYIIGNIFFIKIGDTFQPDVPNKYMKASNNGVYCVDIWTEEEIIQKYPDAKPCKNLQSIGEVWNS